MLPTTHAKTSQAAQGQLKQAAAQHDYTQKAKMVKTVNDAVLEYSVSTGKKTDTAQQEIFTIEHLSQWKCTLCARDIFIHGKMKEINKGMGSALYHGALELICSRQAQRAVHDPHDSLQDF